MKIEDLRYVNQLAGDMKTRMPEAEFWIYHFTITFARLEYALKKIPKFLKETEGGAAEANWFAFAESISQRTYNINVNNDQIKLAIGYIMEETPGVLKVIDNKVEWEWRKFQSLNKLQILCVYLCRIRNNLLHGNKFEGNFEPETRNYKLITSALVIMDFILRLDPELKRHFLDWTV